MSDQNYLNRKLDMMIEDENNYLAARLNMSRAEFDKMLRGDSAEDKIRVMVVDDNDKDMKHFAPGMHLEPGFDVDGKLTSAEIIDGESKRVFVSKTEIQNMYNERMKKLVEAGEDKFQQAQELANWLHKRKGNKFTKPKKKRVRKSDGR